MKTDFYNFLKHIHRLIGSKILMNMLLSAFRGNICTKPPNSKGSHFLLTSKFAFSIHITTKVS